MFSLASDAQAERAALYSSSCSYAFSSVARQLRMIRIAFSSEATNPPIILPFSEVVRVRNRLGSLHDTSAVVGDSTIDLRTVEKIMKGFLPGSGEILKRLSSRQRVYVKANALEGVLTAMVAYSVEVISTDWIQPSCKEIRSSLDMLVYVLRRGRICTGVEHGPCQQKCPQSPLLSGPSQCL